MKSSYQIVGKPGQWRMGENKGNHVLFWKFWGGCNRRISVAIPKSELANRVMEVVIRRVDLSNLEAVRGE